MLNPRRNGAFAAVVVIALALLAPSSALAEHDLKIYKSEAHVDLSSDEQAVSVSCLPGDHALDGMWRIDHADQDDYIAPLDLITGAVDVLKALPNDNGRTYDFSFVKNAIGRVQLKIWVTCLQNTTEGGAHTHSFLSAVGDAQGIAGNFENQTTPVTGTGILQKNTIITGDPCPSGTRLISPGFETTDILDGINPADPVAGMMRIFHSASSNALDWTWKFENSALPATYKMNIKTKWRCLKIKVPPGPDKHKLVFKFKSPVTFNPKKNKVSEGQYTCGSFYKAIVAGFAIPENNGGVDVANYTSDGEGLISPPPGGSAFNNVFYLGMDPRIKQRAFRFVNRSLTTTYPVILSALCLNYRTT